MRILSGFMAVLLLAAAGAALADDVPTQLAAKFGVQPKDVVPAPVAGFYQVTLGPQVAYVSADGRYLLRGDMIQVQDGKDLTAQARDAARLTYLKSLDPKNMIVFKPLETRHVLTVLTDIDCGYCRQLAQDMPELMAKGVEFHYLAFPRTGVDSPSWDKAVNVWCAKDRKLAYQYAMRGADIKSPACNPGPVAVGYDLAQRLGVDGTPVIINENGQLIDGYLPPVQLVKLLDDQGTLSAAAD